MSKETKELRRLSYKDLIKKKEETLMLISSCHRGVNPKVPIGKLSNLKTTIARIETEIRERQK